MESPGFRIGDVVSLADGSRPNRGVVCGVAKKDFTRGPEEYRVAWDCDPPRPPELDPVGVWDRSYRADELASQPSEGGPS